MIRTGIKALCFWALFISLSAAQSEDDDWLIPVPLNNKTRPSDSPPPSNHSFGTPVYPYYEYEAGGDYGSGSFETIVDSYKNVARDPLTNPPCLLPNQNLQIDDHLSQRHHQLNDRRALSVYDLLSEKIQVAGYLAISEHMNKNVSKLELVQFLGGCRMPLAGELIFLIFSAKETVPCVDGVARLWREAYNCTNTETTKTLDRECRARVHISNYALWRPFYINCKSPEFFTLPWKKIQY